MNTSKSAQACPEVAKYTANTVVTQFSTRPVHPACCGATHTVVPVLQLRGLIDRQPRTDQIPRIARQPLPGQGRQPRPQLLPVPLVRAEQGLHPVRRLAPGASARPQQFGFTPGASPATHANAVPALRRCARTWPRTSLTCASTLSATLSPHLTIPHLCWPSRPCRYCRCNRLMVRGFVKSRRRPSPATHRRGAVRPCARHVPSRPGLRMVVTGVGSIRAKERAEGR